MLKGRLGLETARVPHADRHGLLWLARGNLKAEDGTLRFITAGGAGWDAGDYAIPFQTVSMVLLGPGTTVSHDALRLLARHGTFWSSTRASHSSTWVCLACSALSMIAAFVIPEILRSCALTRKQSQIFAWSSAE